MKPGATGGHGGFQWQELKKPLVHLVLVQPPTCSDSCVLLSPTKSSSTALSLSLQFLIKMSLSPPSTQASSAFPEGLDTYGQGCSVDRQVRPAHFLTLMSRFSRVSPPLLNTCCHPGRRDHVDTLRPLLELCPGLISRCEIVSDDVRDMCEAILFVHTWASRDTPRVYFQLYAFALKFRAAAVFHDDALQFLVWQACPASHPKAETPKDRRFSCLTCGIAMHYQHAHIEGQDLQRKSPSCLKLQQLLRTAP